MAAETSGDLNAVVPKATLWKLPSKERVLKVHFLGEQEKWQYKTGILKSWMVMKIIEKGWSMDGVKNGKYVPRFEQAFNKNEAQIRVEFKCEAKGGSHSKLGTKAREVRDLDEPTMVLNLNDCLTDDHIESVILHEFGHALGLGHEHQHPEYLDIMKEFFVKDRAMTDCLGISPNVLRDNYKKLNFELVKTDYDPESIMHYPTKIGMLQEKFRHLRTSEEVDSDPTTKDLDGKKKKMLKNFLDHLDYIASEPSEKDKSTLAQAYFEVYKKTKEYKDDLKRAPQPVPKPVQEPVVKPKPTVPQPAPVPAAPKPWPVAVPEPAKPKNDYDKYAARAPAGKLEQILDEEYQGVDRHLSEIARQLDERMMANELCPELGMTGQEIRDIQRGNAYNPQQMRMKFLSRWKDKEGLDATYENLVKALLKIDNKAGALFVVNLWGKPEVQLAPQPAPQPAKWPAQRPVLQPIQPVPQPSASGKEIELSMRHLGLIKYPGGRFCLRDKVSNKWREFGTNLNIEPNTLDGYNHQTQGSSTECWTKVMQSWLDGQGTEEYPKGWSGLYDMLNDVGVSQIAEDLRSAVEKASNK